MIAGVASIFFYSFMAFVKKSTVYPAPSKLVVFGLSLLGFIGALIPLSQWVGEEFTVRDFLKVVYVAFALPGFAVGIAVFRVLLTHGPGYFAKK